MFQMQYSIKTKPCTPHVGERGESFMACTEAYKEHIMYTFNGFCKTVIRFAAINAWRDRSRRRQKEISLEYLTEEKFYPLGTTDEYFEAPYEEYPITVCGQTVILTNEELAAALLSLPEKKREIIFLYFFGHYTQQEIWEMYGRCRSTAWHHIHSALQMLQKELEELSHEES
jgi:RNA polymerase sigma factor (sigma-70 family)